MNESRNAPCRCGSGVKYKKCCLAKDDAQRKPRRDEDALLILQPTRGTVTYETLVSLDLNVGVPARRLLRIARKPVDIARNELAKYALEAVESGDLFDFTPRETFVLWVDDDAWLPPGLVPAMMQCMREPAHDGLDALFAWFCGRGAYAAPVAYRRFGDGESYPKPGLDCKPAEVVPIEAAGFHCVLMRPRLLQRIGPDPFTPLHVEGEDMAFCRRANAIGARLAVGASMPAAHVDPRDGTGYLPGMPAMMFDGNVLRQITTDHARSDGAVKAVELRGYGMREIETADAASGMDQRAALQAELNRRRDLAKTT